MPRRRSGRPSPATARLHALARLSKVAEERGLTSDEYRELLTYSDSEDQWRLRARKLAALAGYRLQYHTFNSKRSDAGFLDETWFNESSGRLLFFEFKRIDGSVTLDQTLWLESLWNAGYEAACWWPDEQDLLTWWIWHPHPVRQCCLDCQRQHPTPDPTLVTCPYVEQVDVVRYTWES